MNKYIAKALANEHRRQEVFKGFLVGLYTGIILGGLIFGTILVMQM